MFKIAIMQLQKRLNRKIGDKEYSKWQIVIPPETVEKLGWKEGDDLIEEINGYKLTLTPKNKAKDITKLIEKYEKEKARDARRA